jgi:hypothetical protein
VCEAETTNSVFSSSKIAKLYVSVIQLASEYHPALVIIHKMNNFLNNIVGESKKKHFFLLHAKYFQM